MEATERPELDRLAEAITAVAGIRERIPLTDLLREMALNILILARIASSRIADGRDREEIESATDHLVSGLRHAAWQHPHPPPNP
ncbi:hypothetical protein [Glycomyces harbinensis]|uniref:Uncharacterized protein n=1 Tax=Glycomyces harbinensis TaxID=58114 RepID=A0A1G6SZC8_9ACTN|nr:hypothetical protein [Glycomyces harbinensis]SDD22113.1 hypothetical protein SAMN05216270_102386 [Glycomyces harbinensis]